MGKVCNYGKTVQSTMVNGEIAKPTGKAHFSISMAMFMKGIFKMTEQMGTVFIFTRTGLSILELGKMI